jgi:hypothetical protein
MKGSKVVLLVVLLAAGCGGSKAVTAEPAPGPVDRPAGERIFAIGVEDKDDGEFRRSGFTGHSEYRCTVGADCKADAFLGRLHRAEVTEYARGYADGGVQRVVIAFNLKRAYDAVVLRLARGGGETTIVTIDGTQTHWVTSKMLGSVEGYGVGAYNLMLGPLAAGGHTIQLTVADDQQGN